jgi:hypothetical protein
MCDYSLQGLPNRLAVENEELVSYRFPTGSIGMASSVDLAARNKQSQEPKERVSFWVALKRWLAPAVESCPIPAVCIPPGTKLRMTGIPHSLKREFSLNSIEDVTFIQLSAEAFHYRDAIVFRNGRRLLLQSLREGVLMRVLADTPTQNESSEQQADKSARPVEVRDWAL